MALLNPFGVTVSSCFKSTLSEIYDCSWKCSCLLLLTKTNSSMLILRTKYIVPDPVSKKLFSFLKLAQYKSTFFDLIFSILVKPESFFCFIDDSRSYCFNCKDLLFGQKTMPPVWLKFSSRQREPLKNHKNKCLFAFQKSHFYR